MTFEEWQKQISRKAPFASEDEAVEEEETTVEKDLAGVSDWAQDNPWSGLQPMFGQTS